MARLPDLEGLGVLRRLWNATPSPTRRRAAQLTSDYVVANGVHLPTKRRAYTHGRDHRPILEMLMVAIDIGYVSFT